MPATRKQKSDVKQIIWHRSVSLTNEKVPEKTNLKVRLHQMPPQAMARHKKEKHQPKFCQSTCWLPVNEPRNYKSLRQKAFVLFYLFSFFFFSFLFFFRRWGVVMRRMGGSVGGGGEVGWGEVLFWKCSGWLHNSVSQNQQLEDGIAFRKS